MPQFSFVTLDACIIGLNVLDKNNFRRGWNKLVRTDMFLQDVWPVLFILVLGDEVLVIVGKLLEQKM
jgi:hypothetical protein